MLLPLSFAWRVDQCVWLPSKASSLELEKSGCSDAKSLASKHNANAMRRTLLITMLCYFQLVCFAQRGPISLQAGLSFSRFEQQIKPEIGTPRGERLVNETSLGLGLNAGYKLWKYLSAGLYLRYDQGIRESARFSHFDSLQKAVVVQNNGGTFSEFWAGPFLRAEWKQLQLDFGYGLIGLRKDEGRDDIPSNTGSSSGNFSVNPNVAYLFALGGHFPINSSESLSLLVKLEWRIRYYKQRGGDPLFGNAEHGTQNFTPFIGVHWRPS